MNSIYLIIDERNGIAKVGFTADLRKRVYQYTTANPMAYIRDYCITYAKTGMALERTAQEELTQLGGERVISSIDGKRTEWFSFPNNQQIIQRLIDDGLRALQTCKGRKCMGHFTK